MDSNSQEYQASEIRQHIDDAELVGLKLNPSGGFAWYHDHRFVVSIVFKELFSMTNPTRVLDQMFIIQYYDEHRCVVKRTFLQNELSQARDFYNKIAATVIPGPR